MLNWLSASWRIPEDAYWSASESFCIKQPRTVAPFMVVLGTLTTTCSSMLLPAKANEVALITLVLLSQLLLKRAHHVVEPLVIVAEVPRIRLAS